MKCYSVVLLYSIDHWNCSSKRGTVYYKCLSSFYSPLDKTCASGPFPTVPNDQIFNCLLSFIDKQTLKVECVEIGHLSAVRSVNEMTHRNR